MLGDMCSRDTQAAILYLLLGARLVPVYMVHSEVQLQSRDDSDWTMLSSAKQCKAANNACASRRRSPLGASMSRGASIA
jgi:hypothetical protein